MQQNTVLLIAAAALLAQTPLMAAAPNIPFGSHAFSYATHIKPNTATQAQLDTATSNFYNNWKTAYLQSNKCVAGHYRILYNGSDQTVSEAHGYGMLITVLMAGHDANAQTIFDGMYQYYRAHPATAPAASRLLAWKQDGACVNIEGASTASDGDLDVAMSLVMADRQWGSCGAINYRADAILMINQIKQYDLNSTWKYVKLGNWANSGNHLNSTRSSDFMPSHYRSFQWVTGDAIWGGLLNHTYYLVSATAHATTGLLPDFISSPLASPVPAPPNFLESPNDGDYNWNACRDPWRLATDYLASGDPRAKSAIDRISNWAKVAPISGNPNNVRAGYQLNGTALVAYGDRAFTVPFAVGAMGDASNQTLLNSFWGNAQVSGATTVGYYGDSIKLLCLIVLSGNWWQPEAMPDPCALGTPTSTRTRTATPTSSASSTASPVITPTLTRSATQTVTFTRTASSSATASPTRTATLSSTRTASATPSSTPPPTATPSATITPTPTEIPVGSSPTSTPTVSSTSSQTPSVTQTRSATATSTRTASSSPTVTPSASPSPTPSATQTQSVTPGASATSTSTISPSASPSQTSTASLTASATPSKTLTATPTSTHSPSPFGSFTHSPTAPPTSTPSPSSTAVSASTATPVTGGPLKIESVLPMPNPNPTLFYVKLSSWADQIELRIYSQGYQLITTQVSGPHYPGWTIVTLPAGFLASATNGTYFYTMQAKNDSGRQSKSYKSSFAIYR